jgi:CRP-like cAMP-binding protein
MGPRSGVDKKRILREFPVFSGIAAEHLADLERGAQIHSFQRGQTIYVAGGPARQIYIVLAGQVKLALASSRGNEKVLDVVEPGRTFGESEFFGGQRYLSAALAVKPSQLMSLSGGHVRRVMKSDPRIAVRFIRILAARQLELEGELAASHLYSINRRLLDFFLGLAGSARDQVGETQVALGISKRLLASRFDMQPETLSRTLRDLSDAGLLAVEGSRVRLYNARIGRYLADEGFSQAIVLPEITPLAGSRCTDWTGMQSNPDRVDDGVRPTCDVINMAGRQRMLSQRMAKSWLMLERGLLSRRSRLILRQSMNLFDSQLAELEGRLVGSDTHSAQAELRNLWRPYRSLLDSVPSRKGALALFEINEEVLVAAHRLTVSFEKAEGTRKGELVNLAGRGRMQSQRMAKLFMFQRMGIMAARCRADLEEAHGEFSAVLELLSAVAESTPRIAAELEKVRIHWSRLESAMLQGREGDFSASVRKVFTASENLLQRADKTVDLYARMPG